MRGVVINAIGWAIAAGAAGTRLLEQHGVFPAPGPTESDWLQIAIVVIGIVGAGFAIALAEDE